MLHDFLLISYELTSYNEHNIRNITIRVVVFGDTTQDIIHAIVEQLSISRWVSIYQSSAVVQIGIRLGLGNKSETVILFLLTIQDQQQYSQLPDRPRWSS